MPLLMPAYARKCAMVGAQLKYKWSDDVAVDMLDFDDDDRLFDAIDDCNYKAVIGLGVALCEAVVWRFQGHIADQAAAPHPDFEDGLQRLEAAWAATIDPRYAKDLKLDPAGNDDTAPIEAPFELALLMLGALVTAFTKGSVFVAPTVLKQANLARYLMPDKKLFDKWLASTLKRLVKTFPRIVDYDEETDSCRFPVYDASHEEPVPREFYDDARTWTKAERSKALGNFLETLDPKKNRYLRTKKEMLALGFKAKPLSPR